MAGYQTTLLISDDGSILLIDGEVVTANNVPHGMMGSTGTIELAAGLHEIKSGYWDRYGGSGYQLSYSGSDTGDMFAIPAPGVLYDNAQASGGLDGQFYSLEAPNDGSLFSSFVPHQISDSSAGTVLAADLDSDGDQDILTSNDGIPVWYENQGSLGFVPRAISTRYAAMIKVADEDGDGDLDILTAANVSSIEGELFWHLNDGQQNFTPVSLEVSDSYGYLASIEPVDLDGDSDLDVVVRRTNGPVTWHENLGGHAYAEHDINYSSDGRTMSIADVNGDGHQDIVLSNTILVNDGEQNFTDLRYTYDNINSVFVVDFNEDGRLDAVTISGSSISWFENVAPSADFNGDNIVTDADFLQWQRGYGTSPGWAEPYEGDANFDAYING